MKREVLERLLRDREEKRTAVLATHLESGEQRVLHPLDAAEAEAVDPELVEAVREAVRSDRSAVHETPEGPVFLQVYNPPLRMIVVGAVHVSQALAPMAARAGFEVIIVDPRRAFATEERFPGVELVPRWPAEAMGDLAPDHRTAVVTLTHDPKLDDPALEAALASEAFYVGALGSRRTHARRLERLRDAGFSDEDLERIHGPVGLDIGARTPEEIAVAVLAQVIAVLRAPPGEGRR